MKGGGSHFLQKCIFSKFQLTLSTPKCINERHTLGRSEGGGEVEFPILYYYPIIYIYIYIYAIYYIYKTYLSTILYQIYQIRIWQ